jgi:hypothetical protein
MVTTYTQHEVDEDWMIRDWYALNKKEKRKFDFIQAIIFIQSKWRGYISRKQYKFIYRSRSQMLIFRMKRKLAFGIIRSKYFVISLYKHFEYGEMYYSLTAKECSKSKRCHPVATQTYTNVKLPEDSAMLSYYMH